jgi:hypothetical protein
VLSRLRDWQFSARIEGTGGLAMLSLRVDAVEVQTDPEPFKLEEIRSVPSELFAFVPVEELQEALLGKSEERLLRRVAASIDQIAARVAPETQRDLSRSALSPLEIDADPSSSPAVLLMDWCRSSQSPEEALERLLLSRSETLVDAMGMRIRPEVAFLRWQEQRGLQASPAHAAKLRGFLAECGAGYRVISSSCDPAEFPAARLTERVEGSPVPISS